MLGLEPVKEMIRRRRLQWVAHSARRGQGDFTWRGMRREVEDDKSGWGEQVRNDWSEMGVEEADHWMHLVEDKAWLSRKLRRKSNTEAAAAGVDEADE